MEEHCLDGLKTIRSIIKPYFQWISRAVLLFLQYEIQIAVCLPT
jgi:hypothetical protein